jgi:hypothetical protein
MRARMHNAAVGGAARQEGRRAALHIRVSQYVQVAGRGTKLTVWMRTACSCEAGPSIVGHEIGISKSYENKWENGKIIKL